MEDQIGLSPAHRPVAEKPVDEEKIIEADEKFTSITEKDVNETLQFLKFESEHSAQVHLPTMSSKESEKVTYKLLYFNLLLLKN